MPSTLSKSISVIGLVALCASCGGDGSEPSGPKAALPTAAYRGPVQTTIAYFDPLGNSLGQQTTQGTVDVVVSAPSRAQGEEPETNPIHLDIAPVPGQTSLTGQIEMHSAVAHFRTPSGRLTTLQYWNLQVSGTTVAGALANPHNAEAAVTNFLNALDAIAPGLTITNAFGMSQGTTLSGTITPSEARLRLTGNVLQGTRLFQADIVAPRAQ
jgi:hypothetical protein